MNDANPILPLEPPSATWQRRLQMTSLTLGSIALVLGVVFVVAYNWADLGAMVKFALLQSLVVAVLALGAIRGLDTLWGKVALTAAVGLIGPLLALFGQVYQTGADVSDLFLSWALLSVPWVLASRFAPAWLVLVGLLETALFLRLSQHNLLMSVAFGFLPSWSLVVAINAAVLLAWEGLTPRYPWLQGRAAPRMVAAMVLLALTAAVVAFVFDHSVASSLPPENHFGLAIPLWLLTLALGYGSVSIVIIALGARFVESAHVSSTPALLFMGLVVMALTATGLRWLRAALQARREPGDAEHTHWFVEAAAGLGAWLAASLLSFFLVAVLGSGDQGRTALLVLGALSCIGGYAISSGRPEQVFRNQFALALAFAGLLGVYQSLVGKLGHLPGLPALAIALQALAMWWWARDDRFGRVMALIGVHALVWSMVQNNAWLLALLVVGVGLSTVWATLERWQDRAEASRWAALGLVLALVFLELAWVEPAMRAAGRGWLHSGGWIGSRPTEPPVDFWLARALMLALVAVALAQLRRANAMSLTLTHWRHLGVLVLCLGLVAATLWFLPVAVACLVVWLYGHLCVRKTLIYLSTLFLMLTVGDYYYALELPLWQKGLQLGGAGLALLATAALAQPKEAA